MSHHGVSHIFFMIFRIRYDTLFAALSSRVLLGKRVGMIFVHLSVPSLSPSRNRTVSSRKGQSLISQKAPPGPDP